MSIRWEPKSFEDFVRAYNEGRCGLALSRGTRRWAHDRGWIRWNFGFRRRFIRRIASDEESFWQAFNEAAFDVYLRE